MDLLLGPPNPDGPATGSTIPGWTTGYGIHLSAQIDLHLKACAEHHLTERATGSLELEVTLLSTCLMQTISRRPMGLCVISLWCTREGVSMQTGWSLSLTLTLSHSPAVFKQVLFMSYERHVSQQLLSFPFCVSLSPLLSVCAFPSSTLYFQALPEKDICSFSQRNKIYTHNGSV